MIPAPRIGPANTSLRQGDDGTNRILEIFGEITGSNIPRDLLVKSLASVPVFGENAYLTFGLLSGTRKIAAWLNLVFTWNRSRKL